MREPEGGPEKVPAITVKNWANLQHFRDRDPIWIKLYRETRVKREWRKLSGPGAKLLIDLWMLASEQPEPGVIEIPVEDVLWELRLPESPGFYTPLFRELEHFDFIVISDGYLHGDTRGYQDDNDTIFLAHSRETETEKEKETERECEREVDPLDAEGSGDTSKRYVSNGSDDEPLDDSGQEPSTASEADEYHEADTDELLDALEAKSPFRDDALEIANARWRAKRVLIAHADEADPGASMLVTHERVRELVECFGLEYAP